MGSAVAEGRYQADDRGADGDEKETGEKAQDHGKDHFGAQLGGQFFSGLSSLVAKFFRVDAQRIGHTGTETHGLNQQADEAADILQAGSRSQIAKCGLTLQAS